MNPAVTCQACGVALPTYSNDGLCPACMLRSASEIPPVDEPAPSTRLGLPRRFGAYELLEEIGRGGMGVVYRARQHALDRTVALKLLLGGVYSSEAMLRRFQIEAAAAASLQHPGIVPIHDYGEFDGQPFYTMELMEGRNLAQASGGHPLAARRAAGYLRAIAVAVQFAHERGILHRDLKPSNVLVDRDDRPRVADFGMAKRLNFDAGVTLTGQLLGSPNYVAPEQAAGRESDIGVATDVYALGAMLYHLLTGRPPFLSTTLEETLRLLHDAEPVAPRALNPEVPRDLETICLKCLAKEPPRRYASAAALVEDLDCFLSDRPIHAQPPAFFDRARKFTRRNRTLVVGATAVTITLVAGLIVSAVLLVRAVSAERAESQLRQQAETARELETKRSARTALNLASQLLEKGQTAEALAYFVHAARKDPGNVSIAPRLASLLTSHNFLIPQGAPLQCGSRVLAMRYTQDGRSIYVGTEDGIFRAFDADSGALVREIRLGKAVKRGGWTFARDTDAVFAIRFVDDMIALFGVTSGRPRWPAIHAGIEFGSDAGLSGREAVQLSPDGRWFYANGMYDFWLFDALSGERRMNLHFTDWHFGPDFAPDGSRLVISNGDVVRMWSLPDCTPVLEPIPIPGRSAPGLYLPPVFSPDGRTLAVCDPFAGVYVFDARTGKRLGFVARPAGFDPSSAGFLADGRMFIAGDRSAELLNLETSESTSLPVIFGFSAQSQRTGTADGRLLLTVSNDGFARLWDTSTGRLVSEPTLHQPEKFCVALSPDGGHLLIGTGDGEIYRLRVGGGAARPLVLPQSPPMAWHPFLRDPPARVFSFQRDHASAINVATGREVASGFAYPPNDATPLFEQPNLGVDARNDFRFLLVRDVSGGTASRIWEILDDGSSRATALQGDRGSPPGGIGVVFSPVGDLVARRRREQAIAVWDLHTGAPVGPGCSFGDRELCLYPGIDFSPDGRRLAGGIFDEAKVVIWEVSTGRVLTVIETRADAPTEKIHFSPDGTRLLTLNERHEAQLWDTSTGKPQSPVIHGTDAFDAMFSPDGQWFATWGNYTVNLWDGHTGAPVSNPSATGSGNVKFSKDGTRIAAFDRTRVARVWDVRTGQALTEPMQQRAPDVGIEGFSPDGHFVQTVANSTCALWSVPQPLGADARIPEWLLRLAGICAMKKIDDAEQCVDAPEFVAQIDDIRRQLDALPDESPYVEWGRWFLDDSPTRSIAPGFTITPAEADKLATDLAATGTINR